MINKQLSVCILGKDKEEFLTKCIDCASKISREVICIDLGLDDQSKSKATKLGARVVDLNSFASALNTEWVIFIKPDEKLVSSAPEDLQNALMNNQLQGYGVYTKSTNFKYLLENYQWVRKLELFKNTSTSAYIPKIEPRLARKGLAKDCIDALTTGCTEKISWICGKIAPGIAIESVSNAEPDNEESPKDHDLRCLKGELVYDVTPGDDMEELSEIYTGFRVVHHGLLNGYMESAKLGFGNPRIYIPMLKFLCEEGCFNEAAKLFEQWIERRPDDKSLYYTQLAGGTIYTNLLEFDKAIELFEMISETRESPFAMTTIGRLYLIKGEREKAIKYLRKSNDVKDDIFLKKKILSIIDKKDSRFLKLSLCMIARDEETQIGKALESVKDIVDEIIVVDTGSTDKTRDIAKSFGAKVVETKWEDDFSKARNIAIEHATGDYILFMDADEFIDSRDKFALALFKKILPVNRNIAFLVKVEPSGEAKGLSVSYLNRLLKKEKYDYQIRLFPRKPEIMFQGRVLEGLDQSLKDAKVIATKLDLFKITHSMQARELRDRRKIPAVSESFESIDNSHKALSCALIFLHLDDLDRAFPWLMKSLDQNPVTSSMIGRLYSIQNKLEMAEDILAGAMKKFPESPDLILSIAEVYYKKENYNKVINILADQVEIINENLKPEDAAAAHYYLGIASIETGNTVYGIEQLAIAHEKDPANICYKIAGAFAFAKAEHWEETLRVAAQIADEEGIKIESEINDFVDVAQVFLRLNSHFTKKGKADEANLCQRIVEDIVKTKVSGDEDIQRMSTVIEGIGSHG